MSTITFTADAAAMALFARQHGYARVEQLYEIGLTRNQVAARVRKGLYIRVCYGVVALADNPATLAARAMRGVMVAGAGTAAGYWTAAELHGLQAPRDRQIHVVARNDRQRRPTAELYVHRTRFLPPSHIITVDAVPTTTLERTITDCAMHLDRWSALRMLDSCSPSASTWRQIHRVTSRLSNGRAGVRVIADATAPDGAARFRSFLERLAGEVLRTRGVPDGQWNVPISDVSGFVREVDLVFADARLVVEFDGLRFHSSHIAMQRDRATDRRLQAAGWIVLRFTWDDVANRPQAVVDDILRVLNLRSSIR
ncbi:MAG TPA: DUF559 domain-containing protein [Euzebyales bacterium]|nr:DUF559 domain-containing protein [Euzebyales bacterium]